MLWRFADIRDLLPTPIRHGTLGVSIPPWMGWVNDRAVHRDRLRHEHLAVKDYLFQLASRGAWWGSRFYTNGDAVVDIFRLKDGNAVERWDVIQAIPDTSLNENTMF
jgi:hypothetical protein